MKSSSPFNVDRMGQLAPMNLLSGSTNIQLTANFASSLLPD